MIWAVAGRFAMDPLDMRWSRVVFYYRGHVAMYAEEQKAADGK